MNGPEAWVSCIWLGGQSAAWLAMLNVARAAAASTVGQTWERKSRTSFMRSAFRTPGGVMLHGVPVCGEQFTAGEVRPEGQTFRRLDIERAREGAVIALADRVVEAQQHEDRAARRFAGAPGVFPIPLKHLEERLERGGVVRVTDRE